MSEEVPWGAFFLAAFLLGGWYIFRRRDGNRTTQIERKTHTAEVDEDEDDIMDFIMMRDTIERFKDG